MDWAASLDIENVQSGSLLWFTEWAILLEPCHHDGGRSIRLFLDLPEQGFQRKFFNAELLEVRVVYPDGLHVPLDAVD